MQLQDMVTNIPFPQGEAHAPLAQLCGSAGKMVRIRPHTLVAPLVKGKKQLWEGDGVIKIRNSTLEVVHSLHIAFLPKITTPTLLSCQLHTDTFGALSSNQEAWFPPPHFFFRIRRRVLPISQCLHLSLLPALPPTMSTAS